MSDVSTVAAGSAPAATVPGSPAATSGTAASATNGALDKSEARERFIPITRFALIDRLTSADNWAPGMAAEARRFFRYLDYWRQQQYNAKLLGPDSDLLVTRQYTEEERDRLRRRVVEEMEGFLRQANYVRINPQQIDIILTRESYYGLDLHVDLGAFDELLIFYRGASTRKDQRRVLKKFFRKQEFEVPIFRRLFVLFKLKPEAQRVEQLMRDRPMSRRQARRFVRAARSLLPPEVKDSYIYMKLFKNMPRTDIEMIFPNTQVQLRMFDKIKLGVTGGAGLGVGAFSAAGKIALAASNPVAAAGAAVGLAGICFRQAMNFLNQRQRYMVIMAQNLYFHAMADNRGVAIKLADRAAEEDVKEEILLYAVLANEKINRRDLDAVDARIERFLAETFGVTVDFDLEDALGRLIADGIVTEGLDGMLEALTPAQAALHIDRKWDLFLDELPDGARPEGTEVSDGYSLTP